MLSLLLNFSRVKCLKTIAQRVVKGIINNSRFTVNLKQEKKIGFPTPREIIHHYRQEPSHYGWRSIVSALARWGVRKSRTVPHQDTETWHRQGKSCALRGSSENTRHFPKWNPIIVSCWVNQSVSTPWKVSKTMSWREGHLFYLTVLQGSNYSSITQGGCFSASVQ